MKPAELLAVTIITALLAFGCNQSVREEKPDERSQQGSPPLAGNFTIEGSFALHPLMVAWADSFERIHPAVSIDIRDPINRTNLADHFTGAVDLVMLARELSTVEDSLYCSIRVAKLGVIPVINKKNPYLNQLLQEGITHDKLSLAFISEEPVTWGQLLETDAIDPVHVYGRESSSGAAWVWANFLLIQPDELKGQQITGDQDLIARIQEDPLGIGFCNILFAFDPVTHKPLTDIQPLPIDFNYSRAIEWKEQVFDDLKEYQRAVCIGKYPRGLCRYLILVAREKPTDPAIREFVNWILENGQDIAFNAGYSPLHGKAVECAKQCLKD